MFCVCRAKRASNVCKTITASLGGVISRLLALCKRGTTKSKPA